MDGAVVESRAFYGEGAAWFSGPAMEASIAVWRASAEVQKDPYRTRQLLAQIAIHLILQFRTEEGRLLRAKAPELPIRQAENYRLALQLRHLMAMAERGDAVGPGLRSLLEALGRHQSRAAMPSSGSALDH
jgi:hypothetical protein